VYSIFYIIRASRRGKTNVPKTNSNRTYPRRHATISTVPNTCRARRTFHRGRLNERNDINNNTLDWPVCVARTDDVRNIRIYFTRTSRGYARPFYCNNVNEICRVHYARASLDHTIIGMQLQSAYTCRGRTVLALLMWFGLLFETCVVVRQRYYTVVILS